MTDPSDTIVIEGERERQGDFIFTAHLTGEYSFCFSNQMSSFTEKLVDFDIMVESEPRPVAPAKPTGLTEQTSSLEESIYKLSGSLSSIQRTQQYFRTRENRNVSCMAGKGSRGGRKKGEGVGLRRVGWWRCEGLTIIRCLRRRWTRSGARNGAFSCSPPPRWSSCAASPPSKSGVSRHGPLPGPDST